MKIKLDYGTTENYNSIYAYLFQEKAKLPLVLILAGIHGNEMEGVWLANYFKSLWDKHFFYKNVRVLLVPEANPDGVFANTRTNGNGVDLNRNLPTKDWNPKAFDEKYPPGPYAGSESENKALIKLIDMYNPKAILSIHSFKDPQINANGHDETGVMNLANHLLEFFPHKKITRGEEMGYPTPGCLGTFAGYEKKIPTITLELLRGDDEEKILKENVDVIKAFVQYFNKKSK